MQRAVTQEVKLPPGYSISWSGQFEFLERATQKLKIVVPATLVIIFVLLYLIFRRFADALLIMATLPFALVGGFWLHVPARLQHVDCVRRRLHCIGRRRVGDRRRDAGVHQSSGRG